jgi:rubredoxin
MNDPLVLPSIEVPRLAFLGIAERVSYVRQAHPLTWFRNILGLRTTFLSVFYPMSADGWQLLLAWYAPDSSRPMVVRVLNRNGKQLFRMELEVEQRAAAETVGDAVQQREWDLVPSTGPAWYLLHAPLNGLVVEEPGELLVFCHDSRTSQDELIGTITCGEVTAPALTEDRLAAIRSDPKAAKLARVSLGCKECASVFTVVAGLERTPEAMDTKDAAWYADLPDSWTCKCGATTLALQSIRRNMHGLLGLRAPAGQTQLPVSFIRMHEKGTLVDLAHQLNALLTTVPSEEAVQRFLAANTVFLHRFDPQRIRPKARVSTRQITDFAILDSRKVLLLVELERPGLRLMKKNGDVAQDLQHAFDHVHKWLHHAQRRWTSTVEALGFNDAEVAGIRGVVIAGRNGAYPSDHLMRLKGQLHGNIEFYTYDDLFEGMLALARSFDEPQA